MAIVGIAGMLMTTPVYAQSVGVQVGPGVDDLDVGKARFLEALAVLLD